MLARTQAGLVASELPGAELITVETDPTPGDKERFVRGVERAVLDGAAEIGVHSAKDLPGVMTSGLTIGAVPHRADPRDAWIGPGNSVASIPQGARVGTVSLRRRSQLLSLRPDLVPVTLRGNVDSRIRKLEEGEVDGLILALAGLERLGRADEASFVFGLDEMTPAAGQGALVVQVRIGSGPASGGGAAGIPGLSGLNHIASERELLAERAAVVALGADCHSPIGIHARHENDTLVIDGFVGLEDGSVWLRDSTSGDPGRPELIGRELARRMSAAGAGHLLHGSGISG
ncbi:MAG: hydroxymethylbilane synthase [Actinomycetota bacterium]|nr:hydroxymethylbilane synthase [Actinomycetota bacterium]